jgi:hypothetical protein
MHHDLWVEHYILEYIASQLIDIHSKGKDWRTMLKKKNKYSTGEKPVAPGGITSIAS